jgi:hypothetical protein
MRFNALKMSKLCWLIFLETEGFTDDEVLGRFSLRSRTFNFVNL